jgi:catechol 2,3-dioxygenase-like lactoylglutathione lyase family enzyme
MLLYSAEPDALRASLRDVFGFPSIDAGGGWLIFALPPSELGVHPAEGPAMEPGAHHQVSFMCDDIHATVAELRAKGVRIDGEPEDRRFGIAVTMTLPGDVKVMLYEPRHALAITPGKS